MLAIMLMYLAEWYIYILYIPTHNWTKHVFPGVFHLFQPFGLDKHLTSTSSGSPAWNLTWNRTAFQGPQTTRATLFEPSLGKESEVIVLSFFGRNSGEPTRRSSKTIDEIFPTTPTPTRENIVGNIIVVYISDRRHKRADWVECTTCTLSMSPDSLVGNPMLTVSECLRRIMAMAITTQQGSDMLRSLQSSLNLSRTWRVMRVQRLTEAHHIFLDRRLLFSNHITWSFINTKPEKAYQRKKCHVHSRHLVCNAKNKFKLTFYLHIRSEKGIPMLLVQCVFAFALRWG